MDPSSEIVVAKEILFHTKQGVKLIDMNIQQKFQQNLLTPCVHNNFIFNYFHMILILQSLLMDCTLLI